MPKGRGGARRGHEFFGNQYTKIAKYTRRGRKRLSRVNKKRVAIRGLKLAGAGIAIVGAGVSARYGGRLVGKAAGYLGRPMAASARYASNRGYRLGVHAARGAAAGVLAYSAASSLKTAGFYAKGAGRLAMGKSFHPALDKTRKRRRTGRR